MSGKQRRGRPNTSYSDNIANWLGGSMDEVTRDSRDHAMWRKLVRGAARAVDHHH